VDAVLCITTLPPFIESTVVGAAVVDVTVSAIGAVEVDTVEDARVDVPVVERFPLASTCNALDVPTESIATGDAVPIPTLVLDVAPFTVLIAPSTSALLVATVAWYPMAVAFVTPVTVFIVLFPTNVFPTPPVIPPPPAPADSPIATVFVGLPAFLSEFVPTAVLSAPVVPLLAKKPIEVELL
jgi:hypothetical protein